MTDNRAVALPWDGRIPFTEEHHLVVDFNHQTRQWQASLYELRGHALVAYGAGDTPQDALRNLTLARSYVMRMNHAASEAAAECAPTSQTWTERMLPHG